MGLTSKNTTVHPMAAEYIFFSTAHCTLSRTGYVTGHYTNLSKFKTDIILSIFSDLVTRIYIHTHILF